MASSSAIQLRPAFFSAQNNARRSASISKKIEKAEARLKQVAAKARTVGEQTESAVITIGVPAVLGLLKANGTTLPTFGGFNPLLLWGAPLALLGSSVVGGKMGKRLTAAGVGMLAVASHSAAESGTFKSGGDEIGGTEYEIGAADDEIGADDDD
jgi:hypothetical protein